ncbi:delta serrate ligand, partial [Opisthorchis viverrini]
LCLTATRQSSNFSRPPSDCILGRSSQPITIDSPDSVKLSVPVEGSSWLMEFDGILRIVKEYKNKSRSVLAESRWTENNLIKTLPPTSVPSDLGSNFVHLNTVMRTPLGESIPMSLHYRLRCKRHFYGQGCGVFCHGQRGTHGNYECDPNTGHIVCLDGWRGDRCTE